jgi:arabinogalactan oligomer/maltooligosaccharide transport system substrate-binding protein
MWKISSLPEFLQIEDQMNRIFFFKATGLFIRIGILASLFLSQFSGTVQQANATGEVTPVYQPLGLLGTITLWYGYEAGNGEETALLQVIANAEADNPGLDIIPIQKSFDTIYSDYEAAVNTGGGPDLLLAPNDNLGNEVRAGQVLNLDSYVTSGDLANFTTTAVDGMKVDDSLYGIPESSKAVALYYNKTMVTTPPTDTTELLSLVTGGKTPAVSYGPYYLYGFWSAFGGQLMDANGTCTADAGGFDDAMQYFLDLQAAGAALNIDYGTAQDGFLNGTYAMLIDGPWVLKEYQTALGTDLGVVVLPDGPSGNAMAINGIDGFYVNPNSPIPADAVNAALYMTNQASSQIFTDTGGHIPVRTDVSSSDPSITAFAQASAQGEPRSHLPHFTNYWDPFGDMFNGVLDGSFTPTVGVQNACDQMNQLNAPVINVRPNSDQLEIYKFPMGSTITVKVYTSGVESGSPDYVLPNPSDPDLLLVSEYAFGDPSQTFLQINLGGKFDIQAGHLVTVSDSTLTKKHVVTELSFDVLDKDADTVNGVAPKGSNVDIWACDNTNCYYRHVITSGTLGEPGLGTWLADWSEVGTQPDEQDIFDLIGGTWVDSSQGDEDGDSTMFGVTIPNPNFAVRANDNHVEGSEWGDGTAVTIKIDREGDGTPEITRTAITGPAPWNPTEIRFDYNFWGEFDIQPGDHVSVTDGSTTKETIVAPLEFTDIDLDIVTGVASPGANVRVWVCDDSDCNYNRHVLADATTGDWQVDFGNVGTEPDEQTIIDITFGTWIDSGEWDDDGDGTMYGINVPNPFAEANVQSNWVHAREWPDGTLMTMEIDDLSNGSGDIDYTQTATMGQAPWNPGDPYDIVADFDMSGFTLEAGDEITIYGDLNGDLITKHLIVSDLQITDLNMANDTISGYATPDHEIEVCLNQPNGCISHWLIADSLDGSWTADYALDLDMQLGDNGWVAEYDTDNDRTWLDWGTEKPHIDAWYMDDQISAYGWLLGEEVTLEIENPSTLLSPDYSTTALVETAPWNPNETHVGFDLSGIFDYKPGMTVTVYNSSATKELLVTNVTVTKVDIATDIVTGKAPSKQAMWMWFADSCCRNFKSNLNGVWSVNFSVPGPNGEPVADIIPDSSGTINAQDADGDNTSVNWSAPSLQSATIKSNGIYDGWILESSENSTLGGTLNSAATTLTLGDDASDRQYRAILHFDTSSLPDTAVITSVTLKVKKQSASTTNPFSVLGSLYVDMRNPAFGLPGLELLDFNLAAKKVKPAVFSPTPAAGWYSARFNNGGKLYINLLGTSQLRLYFSLDDNNNNVANFIRFYSGNAAAGDRPKLIIQYYVP